MMSTVNGCTCSAVRALSLADGTPKDDGWKCIACRGRGEAKDHCTRCQIGLFGGPETSRRMCSECYYGPDGD